MERKSKVLILIIFFLLGTILFAQEEPAQDKIPEIAEEIIEEFNRLSSSEQMQMNMELRTSSLSELAIWCRSLGLPENGTRDDLTKRIREHFRISAAASSINQKKITIESAQISEYFSIDVIGEDYARLKGDVKLSLQDGEKIHKIKADEILFNRSRNIINANGNVIYEKIDGSSVETFRGQSITVNIDNWSSIFLGGSSEKKLDSDGSAYLFSGKVISRSDEDATILSNATISNATSEEAYWSISASRLWLLPGSDFAILNAVLKVGEIPVLYFPAFYYPADELVFHPVIGYRSREGAFVQTTTYIIGQPKADSSTQSSITRILGNSSDNEKELQGLFLHATGRKKVDQNNISLKALVDYYVNLGAYIGLDFSSPQKGILNPIGLTLGVGFTRTISQAGENYSPFVRNENGLYDGSYNWNKSNLFSEIVPFRYRMKLESAISGRYGRLSWSFPFYSDPFVDRDFLKRTESMDWMNMIQQGAALEDSSSESEIGDYRWNMSGNLNPSLKFLAPVVSGISISNISTTVLFRQLSDSVISVNDPYSPSRTFFAPDKYTIYNLSASITGTPVNIGNKQGTSAASNKQEYNNPLKDFGIPISPFEEKKGDVSSAQQSKAEPADIITPPALSNNFNIPGTGNNVFNVDYSITPTSSSELQFWTSKWKSNEDVKWDEYQSILLNITGNGNLNFRMNHSSGIYNNSLSFTGRATWQDYSYLNEEFYKDQTTGVVNQTAMDNARKQQYGQTNYLATYTYNTTIRPIYNNEIFGQSNLQYTFGGTLVKSKKFIDGDKPELEPEWGSWVKEDRSKDIYGLTSHKLSTNFDANIMNKRQNLTLSADLPPLDGLVSGSASFRVWISETSINTRMEKPAEEEEWIFRPIYITETLRFGKSNSFTYYMVIKPEDNNEIETIRSTLVLWNLNAVFTATKTTKSVFNGLNWIPEGEPTLLPKELSLSYRQSSSNIEIIKNRINLTFNVDSTLQFDLQQNTNSNFRFSMGMSTNITGFLELRFSISSINSIIWRYFKNVPGMEEQTSMYPDGPQNNLFIDLFDSFNFMDESKRRRSGFKMQKFDFTATHYLGDWRAEFHVGMYPHQDTVTKRYKFTSDISFLVQWTPIPEIKTDYTLDGKEDRWRKRQ